MITAPNLPEDNFALITQLIGAFGGEPGVAERAAALRRALVDALEQTRPGGRMQQRVLNLIWRDPWMTVARETYIAAGMLARIGSHTLPKVQGGATGAVRYPVLSGEEPWLEEVQQVLLSSEPYRFGTGHLGEARRLCPNARARLVDGKLLS